MDTMKIHALLLLGIVAAGAMTIGNAYAQTNTERLMQVVSDTSSIMDTLDSIQATMAAALSSMADQMASIAAMVSGVDEKVDDIGSDVSHVVDDVEHLVEDVEMLDSKIAEMMAANEASAAAQADQLAQSAMVLPQMQSTLDSIAANTATLASADAVAQNSAAISEITQSISEINTKLEAISESLGVVKQVVEMPPPPEPSDAEALSPANLVKKSSEFKFMAGTFGDSVLKVPTADDDYQVSATTSTWSNLGDIKAMTVTYEAAVSFTCDGNVYITSVGSSDEAKLAYTSTSIGPLGAVPVAAISGDYYSAGEIESVTITDPAPRDVYYRNFDLQHGANLYLDDDALDRTVDMNYYPLEAGMPLNVKAVYREFTQTIASSDPAPIMAGNLSNTAAGVPTELVRPASLYVMINDFANQTRSVAGAEELMTLNVGWTTSESDTKCKFMVTSDEPREMTSKVDFYEVTGMGEGITKNFNTQIACNNQKTTVTDIVVSIPGLKLYNYANDFTLSVMERGNTNDDDKTKLTTWAFNATGSYMTNADALPHDLMKGTVLEFNGNVPDVDSLLIKVSYDTVKGNSCTQLP